MAENAPVLPFLSPVCGKPVHVAFDGGRLTSDAGVLVLAEIERRQTALVEADREVKVLEKLRERQQQQHAADAMQREAKQLDEAGLRGFTRQEASP